jgi:hypothetical protein
MTHRSRASHPSLSYCFFSIEFLCWTASPADGVQLLLNRIHAWKRSAHGLSRLVAGLRRFHQNREVVTVPMGKPTPR